MKKFRKALALVLSMLILLSVSPIAAFAEETQEEENTVAEAVWYTSYGIKKGEGTVAEAVANVKTGGKILLQKDITADAGITLTVNATIDGAGYTITRSDTFDGVMFTVANAAVLTLTNITIDGNADNYPGQTDSIIAITSGQLNLTKGAVLTKNSARIISGGAIKAGPTDATSTASALIIMNDDAQISDCIANNGGAVYLGYNSKMVMNSGSISNCKASYDGGAVSVATASSEFTMAGGEIKGCSCSLRDTGYAGSAVYAGYGITNITDGTITGNTNMSDLGAVYVAQTATVGIGNAAYILGNDGSAAESNVYIEDNAVLNINPAFAEGSKIGVSTSDKFAEGDTVNLDFINYSGDVMGYIYNDADGSTFYNSNGVITLIQCITVTFDPGNGSCPVKSKLYPVDVDFGPLPECDEREGFEFLGWYTATDSLVTESTAVSYYEDITLYAKWENLNQVDNHPFAFIGRFFERIGELLRSVFHFLENLFTGNGNDELENLPK